MNSDTNPFRDFHVVCAQKLCGDWDPLNLGGFVCPFSHVSEASLFHQS